MSYIFHFINAKVNFTVLKTQLKISLFVLFVLITLTGYGQKNDTLYFLNGDKVTCEVRSFQYGYFKVKTAAMSTIEVKYDKLATIYSGKTFEIVLDNKTRVFGSVDTSSIKGTVHIKVLNGDQLTYLTSIVEMTPIKNKFWRRFSGNIDFGFTYTQSTKISQGNFNSLLEYRPRNYDVKLNMSALINGESGSEISRKDNIDLTTLRFLKKRWFILGQVSGEQNTELGLDLRVKGVLGYGKELIHTKSNQFLTSVGVSVNQERSVDSTDNTVNMEGVIVAYYKLFLISIPKVNITSGFSAFPSFTVRDRWRISYDLKASLEIISNFTISANFSYNLDTKPPSEDSSTNDINISTTLGYSFY